MPRKKAGKAPAQKEKKGEKRELCPRCEGTGRISCLLPESTTGAMQPDQAICPDCKGTGLKEPEKYNTPERLQKYDALIAEQAKYVK
jgi:DnaJ-class molecular chaperone